MNRMRSLSFRAIGTLARNPEIMVTADGTLTNFCPISNDDVITSVLFIAAGTVGADILKRGCKGDQLFVESIIIRDARMKDPDFHGDFYFLVHGYRFGARRRPPGPTGTWVTDPSPKPRDGAASEVATVPV